MKRFALAALMPVFVTTALAQSPVPAAKFGPGGHDNRKPGIVFPPTQESGAAARSVPPASPTCAHLAASGITPAGFAVRHGRFETGRKYRRSAPGSYSV